MLDSALGLPSLFWPEDFQWFFIPWPFAMWPPFGSRICSFSIVAKDWQFWLEFHLRFIVFVSFFSRVDTGHVFPLFYISSSFGWVRPGSNVLPFRSRSFGFLLEGSVSCGVCSALGCGTLW